MPWIAEKSTRPTSASRMTARLRRKTAAKGVNKTATSAGPTLAILCCVLAVFDASPVSAQSSNAPRVSCIVNESGDGWVCATGAGFTRADPRVNREDSAGSAAISTPAKTLSNDSPARLDWIAREAMTPAQRIALPNDCCGGFVDPQIETALGAASSVDSDTGASPQTQFLSSDCLSQRTASSIDLRGEVTVLQGPRTITNLGTETSAQTTLDRDANTVSMSGDIAFREPGVLLRGSQAFIDSSSGRNTVDAAHYVLHTSGIHGAAQTIDYDSATGLIMLDNGEFSRCEPGNEFWVLRANAFELDQAIGRGRAKAMSLRIRDIPIFYYPGTCSSPSAINASADYCRPVLALAVPAE